MRQDTVPDPAAGFQYSYDEENRLTAVRRVSGNALLQEIKYDALGRRAETLAYLDPTTGVVSTTPVRTRHIYNGLKVIQEYTVTGSSGGRPVPAETVKARFLERALAGDPSCNGLIPKDEPREDAFERGREYCGRRLCTSPAGS
ncbi:MAG TPA: hypothetical protein PKY77_25470 [Phycisphaerae bacterium]|nr:hypothetical protein [Phycisphaerae bacterium]HRY69121.1 hypothetical protein [Phycisphaerae bacterium]HSA26082.1 hypothetical protein [Phycisphaerae bacterium]